MVMSEVDKFIDDVVNKVLIANVFVCDTAKVAVLSTEEVMRGVLNATLLSSTEEVVFDVSMSLLSTVADAADDFVGMNIDCVVITLESCSSVVSSEVAIVNAVSRPSDDVNSSVLTLNEIVRDVSMSLHSADATVGDFVGPNIVCVVIKEDVCGVVSTDAVLAEVVSGLVDIASVDIGVVGSTIT